MKISFRLFGVPLLAVLACMFAAFILLPNTQVFAQNQIVIAQSDISEKEAYDAAKELGTIEAWEAFLNSYSTGFRADLARAYLKRIASETPKETPAVTTPPPPLPPVETVVAPPPLPALPADISLAVTSQGACSGGQSCNYTVTATNNGGELYSGALTIATSIAPGGALLQGTGTPPYSCQDMGGGAVCSHGDVNLAPGQSATIPMTFTLPRNAGGQVTACASIAWGGVPAILGPIEVQRKLNELGFNAGAVDGQPGRKTFKAIRAYQASAGLQQTSKIDLPLLLSLFAHPGEGDVNPANDQACVGAAVTAAAPPAFTPQPTTQYCADGRLRQGGGCVCPSSVPVWTGTTCVPRKVRNCTGGRYYSKKRKLCLCPSRKPHWYNNRCYAGVDDCPGDSERIGSKCIKQDEPAIRAGGPQVTGCPANTIRIGNSCVKINLAPLFNLGKKPKGGSQTFTGGGNRPNRPQGGATVAQPGGAQGIQGGGNPSMSGGRCPQPSMVLQNGKCKCIGGSVRGACITAFNVKTFACKDLPPGGAWKVYRPDCAGPAKTGGGQPTVTNKPSGGGGLKCAAGTKNIGGKCLSQQQINAGLASRQCRPGNFAAFIPGGVVDCKPCTALWAIKKGRWPYKAGSCQGGVKKPAPPGVKKMSEEQIRAELFNHCLATKADTRAECSKRATNLANFISAGTNPAKELALAKAHISATAKAKQQKPVKKQIICKAGTGLIVQNGKCACPGNKRWNGKVCAATGIKCAPDQKPAGNRCVPRCGIGFRWTGKTCVKDQSKTTTKEIICSSNLVPVNGQCKCPPGLTWNGKICTAPKQQNVPATQPPQKINCTGGRVANRNGQCQCPANKPRWNGGYCKKAKKSSTDKANKFLKQLQQPQQQNQPPQNRPQQQNQNQLTPQQQQQIQKGLNDLGKLLSDARLKRDIAHVTTRADGLKLYAFRYLWSDETHIGVMAQDLLADPAQRDAVSLHESGYYMVDYERLGLKMLSLEQWQSSRH